MPPKNISKTTQKTKSQTKQRQKQQHKMTPKNKNKHQKTQNYKYIPQPTTIQSQNKNNKDNTHKHNQNRKTYHCPKKTSKQKIIIQTNLKKNKNKNIKPKTLTSQTKQQKNYYYYYYKLKYPIYVKKSTLKSDDNKKYHNPKFTTPTSKNNNKILQIKNSSNTSKKHTRTFHNKKTLLICGDIESNPRPRPTLLSNHPPIHLEKQKTYFYKKTAQIKPEYRHILETFIPYLYHTQTINTNPHLIQFCRNYNHCPKSYTFYAILITLAPTPTQCNQLIAENSTHCTIDLIRKLLEWPNPIPTDQHKIINFHLENTQIINPIESIQKELYSFIINEQPNLTVTQKKFPYLPVQMIQEALKCLQAIPNYTHPNPTHNHPPINPQNTPYTNPPTKTISWNCGTLNTALPGLQILANKPTPPSIIAIQETKLMASKSTKYLHRLFPQYKMIFNNTNTCT